MALSHRYRPRGVFLLRHKKTSPTKMAELGAKTLYLDYSECWAVNPASTVGWPRTSSAQPLRPLTADCVTTVGHGGCLPQSVINADPCGSYVVQRAFGRLYTCEVAVGGRPTPYEMEDRFSRVH